MSGNGSLPIEGSSFDMDGAIFASRGGSFLSDKSSRGVMASKTMSSAKKVIYSECEYIYIII